MIIIIIIVNFVHFCWDVESRFNGFLLYTASTPSPAQQKSNPRDLSAMKDRDLIFNKIIKISNSITYFRNRTMLYCNLFIYRLPPSVILSINEDSFWNLSWSGKSALFSIFNTFLLSRYAFVKNLMQCLKLQSLSHRILNFVLKNKEQIAVSHSHLPITRMRSRY